MAYSKYIPEIVDKNNEVYGVMDEEAREQIEGIKVGVLPDLFAGCAKDVLSGETTTDTEPYLFRQSKNGVRVDMELDGGTVAWNQLVQNGNFADGNTNWNAHTGTSRTTSDGVCAFDATSSHGIYQQNKPIVSGHKYLQLATLKASVENVNAVLVINNPSSESNKSITNVPTTFTTYSNIATGASTGNGLVQIRSANTVADATISVKNVQLFDLTAMFGSTIADYVYSLEQSTEGSGIAWLKSYGFFTKPYYAYDAGSLQSVQAKEKNIYDANNMLIHTYPFDTSLTLRGIPKLDSNNRLYYDGDVYEASGKVTRKYGYIVFDGSSDESWNTDISNNRFYISIDDIKKTSSDDSVANIISNIYLPNSYNNGFTNHATLKSITGRASAFQINVFDASYASLDAFKTAIASKPLMVLYELATPTTEQADPFATKMICDPSGTEQFVDAGTSASTPTRDVDIPVGHNSVYWESLRSYIDRKIAELS